jgi:hypothetical protein
MDILKVALFALGVISIAQPSTRTGVVTLRIADRANATPWVAADGPFVAVVWGATTIDGKADVFMAVSRDAGATFGAPAQVNTRGGEARLGGEMPPRVALYRATPSAEPELVVLWTARGGSTSIKVARSRDGGRSFTVPVELQTATAAGDRGWPGLAVDTRGMAHAVWLDHRGLAAQKNAGSTHKGHTAAGAAKPGSRSAQTTADAAVHDGVAMAQRSGLLYAAVMPAATGPSKTPDTPMERSLTSGVCYCCKTAVATGSDNAVFAAWRHVYPGNLRDIAFTMSADGGRTFGAPVRVSEDDWAINGCPDDGPAMAVQGGTVHLVWPSVVGGTQPTGALFYAVSRDGRTFTPRLRVPTLGSAKPAHPQVAIAPTGDVVIAWDEAVEGERVAVLRTLKPGPGGATWGEIVRLADNVPAVYPVLATTARGVVAAWTQGRGQDAFIGVRRVTAF